MTETRAQTNGRVEMLTRFMETPAMRERIFGRDGELRLNLMCGEVELGGQPIGLEEADLVPWRVAIGRITQEIGSVIEPSAPNLRAVIEHQAKREAFHPVETWLTGLKWDGHDRLTGELPEAFGHPAGTLEATMLRRTLRAMAARVLKPGCKVDTVLVLVGPQGRLKSTAFAALAGQWFTDQQVVVESRDSWEMCHRHWVIELGELSSLNRSDLEAVKAFVSKRDDTFRAAYARKSQTLPRRFVLVGTTNHDEFLRDSTGNRRFWPVQVKERIDAVWLGQQREQLLAQAAHEVLGGATWWLDDEEEKQHEVAVATFMEKDPWGELLRAWMDSNPDRATDGVSVSELLTEVLKKPQGHVTGGDGKRLIGVMKTLGASPKRTRQARLWTWVTSQNAQIDMSVTSQPSHLSQ